MNSIVPPFVPGTCIGYLSLLSPSQTRKAIPVCLRLLTHVRRIAFSLPKGACCNKNIASNARTASTTSSSISVIARLRFIERKVFIELIRHPSPRVEIKPYRYQKQQQQQKPPAASCHQRASRAQQPKQRRIFGFNGCGCDGGLRVAWQRDGVCLPGVYLDHREV